MFEKPILNLVEFELEDILTASGEGGDEPSETVSEPEDVCPTDGH